MTTPLVRLVGVSKHYREGDETRHVLRETTAGFAAGELVAIRGRSGSGKSTLLNLVAGIDLPSAGEVFVGETCLSRLSPNGRTLFRRDHIGFVFQFFNLIPTLTVLENVQLPAELHGRPAHEAADRARALLAEVGLTGREPSFPDRLSGGEQQRVAVARALVQDPRLLLADEPTGNLDDATGRAVLALLDRVTRREGRTLVLVTHSAQVSALADRVFTIEDGHVVPATRTRSARPREAVTRTLLLTGLRDLVRRPLHTGLMVLGVALGVAVVIAIDLANDSARRGFLRSTEAVTGRTTHQVRGGPGGLDQRLLLRIRTEAFVRASAPVVEGYAIARDLDRQPLRVLGVDPLSEGPFRDLVGGSSVADPGLARFFTDERAVIVGAPLAVRYGLRPGSPLRVQVQDRLETLEVIGIVHGRGPGEEAALESLALVDIGTAQALFGLAGRLSHIDLVASEAEAHRVAGLLPPEARLAPASEQAEIASQLTEAFRLNLAALSLLALLVGMFLIYNTVTFSVVQRRAVIGTLRLLGTTPAQVLGLVLLEAAAASALGAVLGLGLGWLLAQGAVRFVTRTINDLYFVVSVSGAPLSWGAAAKAMALGLGAGLASALAPALEAARVEPVEALRPSSFLGRARRLLPWVAAAGALLAALGGAAMAAAGRSLVLSFAALFAIVLGLALMAPLATVGAMAAATPALGAAVGTLGRLAARTVTRSVSRTGVAIAALAVAVSVTVGVSLMIRSFRSTVENWLDLTLRADVFIAAPSAGGARSFPVLSPDVPAKVAAVPGVAWVESFRSVRVASPLGEVNLGVADPRRARDARLYRFAEGDPGQAWDAVKAGAVIVTEPFAFRHRLPAHEASVTLVTDRGPRVFPVVGVFYDYATEQGTVFLTRNVYERYWDDRGVTSLGAHLAPGASIGDVTHALRVALAGTALRVSPNRSLREQALRIFDRTFAVTEALRLLAVVVAFIGVWSALMALQVERTRELATLQALGLGRRPMWSLALLETGLMGTVAGLLALPLGWLLAAMLVGVINVRSFGWTMRLESDPWVFVQALALSIGAALLASVYPLLRLERRPLAAALRQE